MIAELDRADPGNGRHDCDQGLGRDRSLRRVVVDSGEHPSNDRQRKARSCLVEKQQRSKRQRFMPASTLRFSGSTVSGTISPIHDRQPPDCEADRKNKQSRGERCGRDDVEGKRRETATVIVPLSPSLSFRFGWPSIARPVDPAAGRTFVPRPDTAQRMRPPTQLWRRTRWPP